jgi:hypothetical protein
MVSDMPLFSERNNLSPKKIFQINTINPDLKTALWNSFYSHYLSHLNRDLSNRTVQEKFFFEEIFTVFFKFQLDEFHSMDLRHEYIDNIKELGFFSSKIEWWKSFDFFEFIIKNDYDKGRIKFLKNELNDTLKKELSAYRLVKGNFTQITSDLEIGEIEKALTDKSNEVTIHLQQSLDHLSNKKSPDYRNSIKESISAVESYCKTLSENPNVALGSALDILEKKKKIKINPSLKEGFKKIYGWTSGADGIRHGLMEEPDIDLEDAQFMLIACSAFINYLSEKNGKIKKSS